MTSDESRTGKQKKTIIKVIRILLTLTILFFFVKMFLSHSDELSQAKFSIAPLPFIAGLVIMFITYFYIALIWHTLTREFGIQLPFRTSLLKWSVSQFARYIPGSVFVLVSRFVSYENHDFPKRKITTAFLLENVVVAYSVLLVFLTFGWSLIPEESGLKLLPVFAVPAGAFILITDIPRRVTNYILHLLKREEIREWPGFICMMKCIILGCLAFLQCGFGFFLVVSAFYPVDMSSLPLLIGAYSGAGIVNLLVFFVPGGIGARDGALAFFLSSIMPVSMALLLAVVCRVIVTIMEILILITSWAWCRTVNAKYRTVIADRFPETKIGEKE